MISAIPWILTIITLIGYYLNIKKKKTCFVVWGFANAGWLVIDFIEKIYAQAFLYFVFLILSIYGFSKWR